MLWPHVKKEQFPAEFKPCVGQMTWAWELRQEYYGKGVLSNMETAEWMLILTSFTRFFASRTSGR
jgi:hypothetical protein